MQIYGSNADDDVAPNAVMPHLRTTDGADTIFAGGGHDNVTGGKGNDVAYLGEGNDNYFWNATDGSDTVDGGAGNDSIRVTGTEAYNLFALTRNGNSAALYHGASYVLGSNVERFYVSLGSGGDAAIIGDVTGTTLKNVYLYMEDKDLTNRVTFSGTSANDHLEIKDAVVGMTVHGLGAVTSIYGSNAQDIVTLDSGAGDDIINLSAAHTNGARFVLDGGSGNDKLLGSQSDDVFRGGSGDDVAYMSGGNDIYEQKIAEGNDLVYGGVGNDTLRLTGSATNDNVSLTKHSDGKGRLVTALGEVRMAEVETITFLAGGGNDTFNIGELGGTGIVSVVADLAGSPDSGAPDGSKDTVIVNYQVSGAISVQSWSGVTYMNSKSNTLVIQHMDTGLDELRITASNGNDIVDGRQSYDMSLYISGGDGNDMIYGSSKADSIAGDKGQDIVNLGAGNDGYYWVAGDGSDIIDGGTGEDSFVAFSSQNSEFMFLTQKDAVTKFSYDGGNGNVETSMSKMESFKVSLDDAAVDWLGIGDLTGSDFKEILVDAGRNSTNVNFVTADGTAKADIITLTQSGKTITANGLATLVKVDNVGPTTSLTYNGGAGDDVLSAEQVDLITQSIQLNGGAGNDVLLGGKAREYLAGGSGEDRIVWNHGGGNDYIDGGDGYDIFEAHSMGANSTIELLASNGKAVLARDQVMLDIENVERILLSGDSNGGDAFRINDIGTTQIRSVDINLRDTATRGVTGDHYADTVEITGSKNSDVITVKMINGSLTVDGLASSIAIEGVEANLDHVILDGWLGADLFDLRGLGSQAVKVDIVGGGGNDTVVLGGVSSQVAFHDFNAKAGDRINLAGSTAGVSSTNLDQWLAQHATDVNGNAVIDIGNGGTLTLIGMSVADLNPVSFIFG